MIQTGDDMPKSMADKPPKYDTCDNHPKHHKDQHCCDHGVLVCPTCCSTSHSLCDTKSVQDACQYVQQNEVDKLCDVNKTYKSQLLQFLSSVDKHGGKLTEQKKTMLRDAQTTYDKHLAEINKSYQNIKTAIEAEYNSQDATVSQIKQGIKDQISRVDAEINFTNTIKGSPITVKTFLCLQESISNTRESAGIIESLKDSLDLKSLSFETNKDIQKLISQPMNFGSINKSSVNDDVNVSVPDIKLPISTKSSIGAVGTKQTGRPQPAVQQSTSGKMSVQMKANSMGNFNVRTQEDTGYCYITGITVTPSGQRLMVDRTNQKVKLFSQDMRFLSSMSVTSDLPLHITMVNDREAVVTVGQSLVVLEVTDRQLRLKRTINVSFYGYGITVSKDKLIVTDRRTIHALDLGGRELWSVGQSLFDDARYVCSNSDGRWVAVTDCSKKTITVLDTSNGAVITSRRLEKVGGLRGVSVDTDDNIIVCAGPNIVVLSGDLQDDHLLCNLGGQAIAYDGNKRQLIVSYDGSYRAEVRCYQLL